MSIFSKINQIDSGKKNILALFLAGVLTLIISVVWYSFSDLSGEEANKGKTNMLSTLSPAKVIKDEFSKAFSIFDSQSLGGDGLELDIASGTASTTVSTTTILSNGVEIIYLPVDISSSTEQIETITE